VKMVALGDIVSVAGGGTPRKSNAEYFGGEIPWVTPKDMKNAVIKNSLITLTHLGIRNSPAKLVPAGSVLVVVRSGVLKHTLPVALAARAVTLNQDMKALIPSAAIDSSYLARLVKSIQPTVLTWVRATTADNFPIDKLLEHQINLPPLSEQRRIAAILDHADQLRRQRSKVQSDLDELIESAFQQMFDESAHDWPIVSLGDLITLGPQNGLYRPAHQYGSGVPIVRIDSFQIGSPIEIANLKRVELSESDAVPYILKDGDIIVNRVNARTHLGKATMVTGLAETTVFESNMMRLRLDVQKVTPEYVDAALRTPQVKRQIQTAAKDAVNQSSINQQDVINLKICLPPLELQHRYIRLRKEIHEQQATCRRSLIAIDHLFASLQSRAFRGEL